jgi:hypothetical protein
LFPAELGKSYQQECLKSSPNEHHSHLARRTSGTAIHQCIARKSNIHCQEGAQNQREVISHFKHINNFAAKKDAQNKR